MNYKIKSIGKKILLGNDTGKKIYSIVGNRVRERRKYMSDEEYVKLSFRENNGIHLNLENPRTFNEKILWLSLHEKMPLKTKCADKYMVREYVKEVGYPEILNELYGVYDSIDQIEMERMPEKFVVKSNLDSGTYAVIEKNSESSLKKLKRIEQALQ